MKRLLTADVHLRPESAVVVFDVLNRLHKDALALGADNIAILGDLWHVRYAVPVELLNGFHGWLHRVLASGLSVTLLAGNHDQIDVGGQNALQVFARPGVEVISGPRQIGHTLWLPYTQNVNAMAAVLRAHAAANPNAGTIAYVHQGVVGAAMNDGKVAVEGDGVPPASLSAFSLAFFGHWHRHQIINGNVVYVGSPWQTRSDEEGQQKGFVLVDEEARRWTFHPIDAGARHFKVGGEDVTRVLDSVRKGDIIRVTEPLTPEARAHVVDTAHDRGVEVFFDPPKEEFRTRLGLGVSASIREHAVGFVEATALDKTPEERATLMTVFDELAARAGVS